MSIFASVFYQPVHMLKIRPFLHTTFLFVLSLVTLSVHGQVYAPVSWSFAEKALDKGEVELSLTADMEPGWHIYAMDLPSDEGPIATAFEFAESSNYLLTGSIIAPKYKTAYDPNFAMQLNYYEKRATFKQLLTRQSESAFAVKGMLTYMVCNDQMCLPPDDVDFSIAVAAGKAAAASAKKPETANAAEVPGAGFMPANTTAGSDGMPGGQVAQGQIEQPVRWTITLERETATSATILAEASIDGGWYVYGTELDGDMGPLPTTFTFADTSNFSLDGPPVAEGIKRKYDLVFEMELDYFSEKATIRQHILKHNDKPLDLSGYLTFMTCDNHRCLAPEDVDFSFSLARASSGFEATITEGGVGDDNMSYWSIFIISFFSGFLALLTPCVFPMIPLTVSYFTKTSKSKAAGVRNAAIYGASIVTIYVVLGVVVTAIFGASVLSELSTDPWFNVFFFLLLLVFAISFLGAFEITLPASWINKADSAADKGGYIGIFFMAFTLALVSFSCTGPIVGTLLVKAASTGGTAPAVGMLGFSLAIALPFALFAAFPGWLNTLPQSGGWLNSVKVSLGFLELALAFKFLSNADMVLQWRLLEREVFLAIWIMIFGTWTLYLLGKIRLPHDTKLESIGVTRLFFALLTGIFTIYMVPGMWGAPLKIISAFPPPMHYSESPHGVGFTGGGGSVASGASSTPESSDQYLGPQGIYVYKDYDKGMAAAKKANKPLMLDFTGHACVNCRKMEEQVWSDPEIRRKLAEDVVLVSLYVDEKTPLPEAERLEVELTGGRKKKLRNVGHKWAAFQEQRYGINAQPYYVLLDHNEQMLNEPANFQDYGEIKLFDDWLKRGIGKFGL